MLQHPVLIRFKLKEICFIVIFLPFFSFSDRTIFYLFILIVELSFFFEIVVGFHDLKNVVIEKGILKPFCEFFFSFLKRKRRKIKNSFFISKIQVFALV